MKSLKKIQCLLTPEVRESYGIDFRVVNVLDWNSESRFVKLEDNLGFPSDKIIENTSSNFSKEESLWVKDRLLQNLRGVKLFLTENFMFQEDPRRPGNKPPQLDLEYPDNSTLWRPPALSFSLDSTNFFFHAKNYILTPDLELVLIDPN